MKSWLAFSQTIALIGGIWGSGVALAAPPLETSGHLQQVVSEFLRGQYSPSEQNKLQISVDAPDPYLRLTRCIQAKPFLIPHTRPVGRFTVGIRCDQPKTWSIYLGVTLTYYADIIVASRDLERQQVVTEEMLTLAPQPLGQNDSQWLSNLQEVIGTTTTSTILAGAPVRRSQLRWPLWVKSGQMVRVDAIGEGFTSTTEGKALANGERGQKIAVRLHNGQVIQAIVSGEKTVELHF